MLLSLDGYRHQGELRNHRRSTFLRWLTVTFLFVNLVACLALITLICNQNEMLKGQTPTEQRVLLNTNINEQHPGIIMTAIYL